MRFRPALMPTLATLLMLPALMALGFWQLDRYHRKQTLQASYEERLGAPSIDLNQDPSKRGDAPAMHWRSVEAHGTWLGTHQLLLDNQLERGEAGYFVYTPFMIEGGRIAVLVNRGWVAAGADRASAPDVRLASRDALVRGRVAPAPAAGLWAAAEDMEAIGKGVMRVQRLDFATLSRRLGILLLPYTIRLDPALADGFRRDWREPVTSPARHAAYAVQWFLFAALLAGLYIGLNLERGARRQSGAPKKAPGGCPALIEPPGNDTISSG